MRETGGLARPRQPLTFAMSTPFHAHPARPGPQSPRRASKSYLVEQKRANKKTPILSCHLARSLTYTPCCEEPPPCKPHPLSHRPYLRPLRRTVSHFHFSPRPHPSRPMDLVRSPLAWFLCPGAGLEAPYLGIRKCRGGGSWQHPPPMPLGCAFQYYFDSA